MFPCTLRAVSRRGRNTLLSGFSRLLLLATGLSCLANAQPGTISTFAGGGPIGINDPLAVPLEYPTGIALGSGGEVYFTASYAVYKISQGTLTLVAGAPGSRDYIGDGGPVSQAVFGSLSGIAIDSAGNLYISDSGNQCVRKIDAVTGIITRVAGTTAGGFNGDNIPATQAQLNSPSSVAVDASGNLYIADAANARVRKVSAVTGLMTTVAGDGTWAFGGDGGLATTAKLYLPRELAFDSAGNLYIADTGNNRVRKVAAGTGVITTVAGGAGQGFSGDGGLAVNAALYSPHGVAVDEAGNLFIADLDNNRIRKVAAGTGIISTVAGNGTAGFSGDGGLAVNANIKGPVSVQVASDGTIYIADSFNSRMRAVTPAGIITSIAGSGSFRYGGDGGAAINATLNGPDSVGLDSAGSVYFPDGSQNGAPRVRKVQAGSGVINTVAGNGTSTNDSGPDGILALSSPLGYIGGLAVDSSGNLYLSESVRVRNIPAPTGVIGSVVVQSSGIFPRGLSVASNGDLYITDAYHHRVWRRSAATGLLSLVAGTGVAGFSGDGGPAVNAALNHPTKAVLDSQGNLYISDYLNHRIRKVAAATGIITTIAGNGGSQFSGDMLPGLSTTIPYPLDVALDAKGNLYFAEAFIHSVRKLTASTGLVSTVAGTGSGGFSGDGGPALNAHLNNPSGLALDAQGNIYIAESGNNRIRKVQAPNATTVVLSSSNVNAFVTDAVTVTATVTPSQAPGSVQFFDGNTYLTSVASANGQASLTWAAGTQLLGTHSLKAIYVGDAQNADSTSSVLTQQFTLPPGPVTPAVSSMTPLLSSGSTQQLSFSFFHPQGYQSLDVINILVNSALDARRACYFAYVRSTNMLYLVPDSGDAAQVTGASLDRASDLQNSQCSPDLVGNTAVGSGNFFTLTLTLRFTSALAGNRIVYAAARDTAGGNSNWQASGTIQLPGSSIVYPWPVSVNPKASKSAGGLATFTYTDSSSVSNLQTVWGLINTAVDGRRACYFAYYVPGNKLYLVPDHGGAAQSTSIDLTGTNTISNSQCTISALGATVTKSGGILTLQLPITFSPAFAGMKVIWMAAQTLSGQTNGGWEPLGSWQVLASQ